MNIFITWHDGHLLDDGKLLLKFLIDNNIKITCSPTSPHTKIKNIYEPKNGWDNWYDIELPKEIIKSDLHLFYITEEVYSSTWMAQEVYIALSKHLNNSEYKIYNINTSNVKLPLGFQSYLEKSENIKDGNELIWKIKKSR